MENAFGCAILIAEVKAYGQDHDSGRGKKGRGLHHNGIQGSERLLGCQSRNQTEDTRNSGGAQLRPQRRRQDYGRQGRQGHRPAHKRPQAHRPLRRRLRYPQRRLPRLPGQRHRVHTPDHRRSPAATAVPQGALPQKAAHRPHLLRLPHQRPLPGAARRH